MATRIRCTGRDFVGITNPYTSEPVVTEMIVGKDGTCLFGAPDTYSPAVWCKTKEEAYDKWCREEGIEGARKGAKIACAFSGAELVVEENAELGVRYVGGFDPRVFRPRHEYLNGITMRGGKLTRPEVKPEVRAAPVVHKAFSEHHEIEVNDEHMKIARATLEKVGGVGEVKKTRVSMSRRTKK